MQLQLGGSPDDSPPIAEYEVWTPHLYSILQPLCSLRFYSNAKAVNADSAIQRDPHSDLSQWSEFGNKLSLPVILQPCSPKMQSQPSKWHPISKNQTHFWSPGSVSCRLPRGLYSTSPSVWNGVNNLFGSVYHMDTAGALESEVPFNIPSYFLPINQSETKAWAQVPAFLNKNATKLLWCHAQRHSVTCSIYISSGILDSDTQLPLLLLLLANAETSARLTLTL